ncbi:bifunctional tRNA (5-methylaminomethyl-2-thiouridine)(34)-methyltransferase MnmD/FAD-dependent 5-carboxymethylaminomethyl-2-thiouridine(34) oxidoreductase MnmC [Thiomicrorhabdus sp. zzn3]|uniref:bifunctional tRNA (5-methylaminomethyl-2-thiouridine)(34)-methyltransferase MnmD/FAD-dependent 5-carboxymethylaminomethyl-2-thiouridine(34) oxidoreductase MnmC n=1 Tax=Thiomicrorhabdus sp. zzn3 TaxID=3039775 RepID=UPI002436D73A|nr:bifunctional tRNA (5-methylaminomethyl-2-thiouridine)(34)-methyltransferase MnmD/FAD-dependent 5-carboxymethylaminomethyl-2-thiouridine(34) oxidoreductase MnmC [Thiomicrorhabdus sp. zzn3]MDG6778868.1 bifunctional tRNA (5-methylaminomethyl-2-thiouridine)(34)-methyltransferase MnmD/FAD-dependent 5-carboxymethylaminomethyl-2-thiouridine(34) oxidoreductase MnmC [Thiomicrorhabdus sp. zzn3]
MKLEKITSAELNWTDEQVPHSKRFDDVYYSRHDGVQEVSYVFIEHNRLPERFESAGRFCIAETGFGTGLNFLVAVHLWLQAAPETSRLHFISFEKFPLKLEDLRKAHAVHQQHPELLRISEALCAAYPVLLPGWHDVWLFDGRVRLTLWFGDVLSGLSEVDVHENSKVDAWFLDGFAPSRNPEMWQPTLFQQMARLSHMQTTFATFTSAGVVRRGLEKVGFAVRKAPGHGKKREMCFGQLEQVRPYSSKAPWFSRPSAMEAGRALVVGAGLAGGSVAYQLAEAGWQVIVLEADEQAAQHASGNLAGAVHPLVTADWNLRSQWYLVGLSATLRRLLPWLQTGEIEGDLTGLLQLAVTDTARTRIEEALQRVGLPNDFAYWMEQNEAAQIAGGAVSEPGLFFPQGGWVNPPSVVKRCLDHANIQVHYQQTVTQVEQTDQAWSVVAEQGGQVYSYAADCVVVASGALNECLNTRLGLPIRPVKGQVTHLKPEHQGWPLQCAVTHLGYSAPCGQGKAVTGATFEAPSLSASLSQASHQANLEQVSRALPDWLHADAREVEGRVAFRPTTPDHLPIIGPVADVDYLQAAYLSQSHTHAVYRYPQQRYQPGLYVSNGHGARGLMSVFLAAEMIVADLQGEALPLPSALYHASHPARFKIRHWRSGKSQ